MRHVLGGLFVITWLILPAQAQYFTCPELSYFSAGCKAPDDAARQEPEKRPPVDPLWSPQTMSPTAPPVAVRMLRDPTPEHALDFARWHLMRFIAMARAQEVLDQTMANDDHIKALQSYFGPPIKAR